MSFEEICKLIAQRLLQGFMNHEQFANYYDFLGLEGYKLFHEYHFFEEVHNYRQFMTYYIDHYNKLITDHSSDSLTSFVIIPGNWYDYLREDMDMNQTEFAKLLDMSQTGYSKYETGENDIPTYVLIKLSDFYGVSIDYILNQTDIPARNK